MLARKPFQSKEQSSKPVVICPDSKAVIDAAKKIAKGHFSLSPKIQTFLNNLSRINYDIQHIAGKSGHNAASDYQSRSSSSSSSELCQICSYVNSKMDTIIDVKLNTISEHSANMPFLNRMTWKHIQEKDRACSTAKTCITTGQQPSKKSGKQNTEIRRFVEKASIATDGLLVVKQSIHLSTTKQERIVIPAAFTQSLVSQLHIVHNHPTKSQMTLIFNKHFFAIQSKSVIDELYETCQLCKAATTLPKELQQYQTNTKPTQPGSHFSIDILRRAKQKIAVCRDQFSSFCTGTIIHDESRTTLLDAILTTTQAIRIPGPITVRVDAATGFQSIKKTCGQTLEKLQINLEIGDSLNKNSNACVDKAIAELNLELKKISGHEETITLTTLNYALGILNNKLRRNGQLSAADIVFSRDRMGNSNIVLDDKVISEQQNIMRTDAHPTKSPTTNPVKQGDLVMLKENPKKHHVRETYIVTDTKQESVALTKMPNPFTEKISKPNNITYNTKQSKVMKLSKQTYSTNAYQHAPKPVMKKATPKWSPIKTRQDSDTSDDEYSEYESENDESDDDENPGNNIDHQHQDQEHLVPPIEPQSSTSSSDSSDDDIEPEKTRTPKRTPVKEMWLTNPSPQRKRMKRTCKKTDQYRDPQSNDEYIISSLEVSRNSYSFHTSHEATPVKDSEEHDIHIYPLEWDNDPNATTPSFETAFIKTPEEYPTNVTPGRVFNFENLTPLPPWITSPPPHQHRLPWIYDIDETEYPDLRLPTCTTSTPKPNPEVEKPKAKQKKKKHKWKKMFHFN